MELTEAIKAAEECDYLRRQNLFTLYRQSSYSISIEVVDHSAQIRGIMGNKRVSLGADLARLGRTTTVRQMSGDLVYTVPVMDGVDLAELLRGLANPVNL